MTRQVHAVVQDADDLHPLIVEPKSDKVARAADALGKRQSRSAVADRVNVESWQGASETASSGAFRIKLQISIRLLDKPPISVGGNLAEPIRAATQNLLEVRLRVSRDDQMSQRPKALASS